MSTKKPRFLVGIGAGASFSPLFVGARSATLSKAVDEKLLVDFQSPFNRGNECKYIALSDFQSPFRRDNDNSTISHTKGQS